MRAFVIALTSLAAVACLPARAAELARTCSGGRQICEATCTPDRLARYYQGSLGKCTASCEPRWQQCLRDGVWVHLEDDRAGRPEHVSRY